jgi:hypothetical protein
MPKGSASTASRPPEGGFTKRRNYGKTRRNPAKDCRGYKNYIWKNPYDYLKYIFEQAPLIKTNDDWAHLLPWNLHG